MNLLGGGETEDRTMSGGWCGCGCVYANRKTGRAEGKIQGVVIASVTTVHADQAIRAIEKGLHVLCEKPLSTDGEIVSFVVPPRILPSLPCFSSWAPAALACSSFFHHHLHRHLCSLPEEEKSEKPPILQ